MRGCNRSLLCSRLPLHAPPPVQVSISADKKQLSELEDKILKLLKESSGNILDDEQLINTLNHSKLTSGVISVRPERELNALQGVWFTTQPCVKQQPLACCAPAPPVGPQHSFMHR